VHRLPLSSNIAFIRERNASGGELPLGLTQFAHTGIPREEPEGVEKIIRNMCTRVSRIVASLRGPFRGRRIVSFRLRQLPEAAPAGSTLGGVSRRFSCRACVRLPRPSPVSEILELAIGSPSRNERSLCCYSRYFCDSALREKMGMPNRCALTFDKKGKGQLSRLRSTMLIRPSNENFQRFFPPLTADL